MQLVSLFFILDTIFLHKTDIIKTSEHTDVFLIFDCFLFFLIFILNATSIFTVKIYFLTLRRLTHTINFRN